VIWTPMPLELVFEDTSFQLRPRERQLPGGGVVLVHTTGGCERVLRLDTTEPQLYLLPEFAPGGLVTWTSGPRGQERPQDGS